MGRLFDVNNPFWVFIGKLIDVVVIHFLWVVCSLPIFTFGASTAAMYYALMNDVADEDPHYVKAFFRSFKMNLKQGIPIGLIMLILGGLLVFSLWFYNNIQVESGTTLYTVMNIVKGINIMFLVLYSFVFHYIFAVFARFDNTIKNLFQNAFFLSIKNLGWTLLMIACDVAIYVGILIYLNFIPILIWGYGLTAYVSAYFLNRIFKPYIKEINGDVDEINPDEWEVPEDITDEQVHIILGLDPNESLNTAPVIEDKKNEEDTNE